MSLTCSSHLSLSPLSLSQISKNWMLFAQTSVHETRRDVCHCQLQLPTLSDSDSCDTVSLCIPADSPISSALLSLATCCAHTAFQTRSSPVHNMSDSRRSCSTRRLWYRVNTLKNTSTLLSNVPRFTAEHGFVQRFRGFAHLSSW